MATTLYLRDVAFGSCGPGAHRALSATQGSSAATVSLDATGDTWSIPFTASPTPGTVYAGGTWKVPLYLRGASFGNEARVVLARYTSGCSLIDTIVDVTLSIAISGGFILYTFSASVVPQIIFGVGELLLCIVTETSGDVIMEYDQAGLNASLVVTPDVRTVRPHYYYQRNTRRRSA